MSASVAAIALVVCGVVSGVMTGVILLVVVIVLVWAVGPDVSVAAEAGMAASVTVVDLSQICTLAM